jgi:hypothetical protein
MSHVEPELTNHELKILREIAGLEPVSEWGAWVGACLESLAENGYITRKFGGKLTVKGHRILRETAGNA